MKKYHEPNSSFIILAGIVAIVVWVFPWKGWAIPETISSFAASVWSVILSVKMVMQASKK